MLLNGIYDISNMMVVLEIGDTEFIFKYNVNESLLYHNYNVHAA